MAMKDFLRLFPKPDKPMGTRTGLFKIPVSERKWSDKPKKSVNGVSYTLYSDAMGIPCGEELSLFDCIHGLCWQFAVLLHSKHPDWRVRCLRRGTFWDSVIHCFCTFEKDGVLHFADARGIADDPEEFFADFECGKNVHLEDEHSVGKALKETEAIERACGLIYGDPDTKVSPEIVAKETEACRRAYALIYENAEGEEIATA